MSKIFLLTLILFGYSSCVVSKKKYIALEQELTQIKTDLQDDDKDGIPNYVDLEPKTDSLANVDSRGRTIIVEKIVDIDGDGVLDVVDFCPTIKGVAAANGCPDKDGDGVYDFADKCPNASGLKKDGGCPVIIVEKIRPFPVLKPILFQTNSIKFADLKADIDKQIDSLSEVLIKNPTYWIEIIGHSNDSKDSLKNMKLSIKRAEKVKALFLKRNVLISQLKIIGKGSAEVQGNQDDKKGNLDNNRVEFIFKFEE
ncbi:MAG: OmpA family protein [Flavobacteriia bacterium]|jgi:OOP family OmpA-OmpF porin